MRDVGGKNAVKQNKIMKDGKLKMISRSDFLFLKWRKKRRRDRGRKSGE